MASTEQNGDSAAEARAPLTSAQRLAASSGSMVEVPADPFGKEAKHFTEIRVLHRDVSTFCCFPSVTTHRTTPDTQQHPIELSLYDVFAMCGYRLGLYWRVLTSSTT